MIKQEPHVIRLAAAKCLLCGYNWIAGLEGPTHYGQLQCPECSYQRSAVNAVVGLDLKHPKQKV